WAVVRRAGRRLCVTRIELFGKRLVLAGCASVTDRLEHHLEPGLRFRQAIPRAMKCDEDSTAVLLGKGPAGVKGERVRCPMSWIRRDRPLLVGATSGLLAVAAVFGRVDELLLRVRVETVGPAEIVALVHLQQLFRR